MLENPLLVTLAILLAGALISGFLKGRQKDRCLSDFAGYHVTLERLDGRLVWGELVLHSTGMELIYPSDVQDEHHIETSYILYREEFPHIQAIYRYCDQMADDQWARRQREMERSFHPSFWRRLQRHARNFLHLISDSLSQAIGILVGQIQTSSKKIGKGSEIYLSGVGQNIIGYVGTRYDPLLEQYVGTRVVVEVTEGGVVYEHIGILKDYTGDYLEILDVHYPRPTALQIEENQDYRENQNFRVKREGDTLYVVNAGEASLLLQNLRVGTEIKPLNAVLDKDDEIELHLPEGVATRHVEIQAKVVRHLDWVLPRSHALIRHKAERYDPDQVFDFGVRLRLDRYTEDEERYVRELAANAEDALCAVELGRLLYQRGAFSDAEYWLRHALQYRDKLLDGGKTAERRLRRIVERKANQKRAA